MKRLLVFVFAVAFLGSCSKTRNVHFEAVMISNTNINCISFCGSSDRVSCIYNSNLGIYGTSEPILVGERCLISSSGGYDYEAKKKDRIPLRLSAFCDYISNLDTTLCDFEVAVGFFVDDILVEDTTLSRLSFEKNLFGNPNNGEFALEETIIFVVP